MYDIHDSNSGHGTNNIFLPQIFFPSHSVSLNLSFQSIVAKLVALNLPWISIQDQGSVEYPQA